MAAYYLPIKIGTRRMHICHLDNPVVDNGFEFIIPVVGNHVPLFSIDNIKEGSGSFFQSAAVTQPKIISGSNANGDIKLNSLRYEVTRLPAAESETANPKELSIRICFSSKLSGNKPLKGDPSRLVVERDGSTNNFVAWTSEQTELETIRVTIVYIDKEKEFAYNFVIHTPKENDSTQVQKVAIDFGSEASQISFRSYTGDRSDYVRMVDVLRDFYPQYQNETIFWQGKYQDTDPDTYRLYKSIFFINRNPVSGFQFHDVPNKYKKNTMLQTLAPLLSAEVRVDDAAAFSYHNLSLLPNLKLVELLPNSFMPADVHFPANGNGSHKRFSGSMNILSADLIPVYIRLILNNFMYIVLEKLNTSANTNKFLQVTLLMPNVYSQVKVYNLIRSMYADFRSIIANTPKYKDFKGIEIQAMSESDASFVGAKFFNSKDPAQKILSKADAVYLVIDAGKGTTDFSIIKQRGRDHTEFESIFRTGLPGSGQYISYAFIEALQAFLRNIGFLGQQSLSEIIYADTTEISRILIFMDNIEKLKINYENSTPLAGDEIDQAMQLLRANLGDTQDTNQILKSINEFTSKQLIEKNKRIPGCEAIIDKQIGLFLTEIENCINISQEHSFFQVVLAGRAFRFKPLYEAVKRRLDNLATADNKVVYQKEISKIICVEGAFSNEHISINLNSELIGSPIIEDVDIDSRKKNEKKNGASSVSINEKFFYDGLSITDGLLSKDIRIGARKCKLFQKDRNKKLYNLYYTGDGFILRWNDGAAQITEDAISQDLTDMVEATLFPFAKKGLAYAPTQRKSTDKEDPGKKDDKPEDKSGDSNIDELLD